MTRITKTSEDIRAHRPDAATIADWRAKADHDRTDAEAPIREPIFRIREAVRRRIVQGSYRDGDVAAFRTAFRAISQERFAAALGISVDTLQNWEQGRRQPDGPARALLRLLARHPRLLLDDLVPMAG